MVWATEKRRASNSKGISSFKEMPLASRSSGIIRSSLVHKASRVSASVANPGTSSEVATHTLASSSHSARTKNIFCTKNLAASLFAFHNLLVNRRPGLNTGTTPQRPACFHSIQNYSTIISRTQLLPLPVTQSLPLRSPLAALVLDGWETKPSSDSSKTPWIVTRFSSETAPQFSS